STEAPVVLGDWGALSTPQVYLIRIPPPGGAERGASVVVRVAAPSSPPAGWSNLIWGGTGDRTGRRAVAALAAATRPCGPPSSSCARRAESRSIGERPQHLRADPLAAHLRRRPRPAVRHRAGPRHRRDAPGVLSLSPV